MFTLLYKPIYYYGNACVLVGPPAVPCGQSDARTGTLESAKAMSRTSKMTTDEAMQILNLKKGEIKPNLISKVGARSGREKYREESLDKI